MYNMTDVQTPEAQKGKIVDAATTDDPRASGVTPQRIHRDFLFEISPALAAKLADQADESSLYVNTRLDSQHYCGSGAIVGSSPDRSHIVIVPMTCKSWDCPRCGPRKRAEWIRKFKNAKPEREITLTCPANKFANPHIAAEAMKMAWLKLIKRIRDKYGEFEYGLVFELTKKNTPHMHILCRGKYIPQKWLSNQWHRLGIGYIVHIQKVDKHELHAAHVCKYLAKSIGQTAEALAPQRIIQVSKKFLLPEGKEKDERKYKAFSWVWISTPVWEIAERFMACSRYHDCLHNLNGSLDIFLDPSPPPLDIIDTPNMWVADPSVCACVDEYINRESRRFDHGRIRRTENY